MKIKPGYKQTEAGVIPADWEVKTLGQIGIISGGGVDKKVQPEEIPVRLVNYMDVYRHGFIRSALLDHVVSAPPEQAARCAVCKGDVYFTPSSEIPFDIAVSAVAMEDIPDACHSYHVVRLRLKEDWDLKFRAYAFSAQEFLNQAAKICEGSGVRYVITQSKFRALTVCYPPNKTEQAAIATALSDVDVLLDGLDRLIAKKRAIKLATIQQLLTGKTRLPGFREEWKVKRLGDVADMASGGTPLSSVLAYYGGDIPWVSIADMTKAGKVKMTEKTLTPLGFANSAARMFPVGTVLYAMYASLGECSIADIPVCTSQAILGIQPKSQLQNKFLYYFLNAIKKSVKTAAQHSTQPNLNKGIVQNFHIALPSYEEQTAIAAVLSDMDDEIAAIEARREKTRALKYAMMGELLTGKTRLVKPKQKNANA